MKNEEWVPGNGNRKTTVLEPGPIHEANFMVVYALLYKMNITDVAMASLSQQRTLGLGFAEHNAEATLNGSLASCRGD